MQATVPPRRPEVLRVARQRLLRRAVSVAVGAIVLASALNGPALGTARTGLLPPGAIVADVVVYAATPSGVLAAVTAGRAGARVTLIEPSSHVGGMMANGLSFTDVGDSGTLGGYTKEFFNRVQAIEGSSYGRYHFEPHVAEQAFGAMLASANVAVYLHETLAPGGVVVQGHRIVSVQTSSGRQFAASVFIDASYEGDLMAEAGVSYTIGRESSQAYGESLAGVRPSQPIMEVPAGVALPSTSGPPGQVGSADNRIQDANFRLCFSSVPSNQVAFARPSGYDASDYAIVADYIAARASMLGTLPELSWVLTISPTVNSKFDVNGAGAVSLALTGGDYDWPDGDAATRAAIAARHAEWDRGLLYFLANDAEVPARVRAQLSAYGLCRDEFVDNGSWPRQLYIREARRMVGAYVLTQADLTTARSKADIIGIGSYRIDAHTVSLWVDETGVLRTEGQLWQPYRPYAIPYRSLTPLRSQVTNLLVSVAISASHVAYASFRMEPQYMLTGEAAGEAAWIALPRGTRARPVQDISIAWLQALLRAHGSFLNNLGSR